MAPAQREQYRERCLDPSNTLADVLAWLTGEGVSVSLSAVHRDAQWFAADAATERIRRCSDVAAEIGDAVRASGDVSAMPSATINLFVQRSLDFLLSNPDFGIEDLTRWGNFGKSLASVMAADLLRYKAQVEADAREAAAEAKRLAGESTGDMREQLEALADGILSVGK